MLVTRWIEDGADDGCNEIAAIRIGRHSVASVSGRSRGPSDLHDGRPRTLTRGPGPNLSAALNDLSRF